MDINPGQELRDLLIQIFPPNSPEGSFVSEIDKVFFAEDEFKEIVYQSCINYMVRRLITTAEYLRRQCEISQLPERIFVVNLRKFLKEETQLPHSEIERVLDLLLTSLRIRQKDPTRQRKKLARKTAQAKKGIKAQHGHCYICGVELDFDRDNQPNSAEIEHVWPNALGGSNEIFNLRLSCRRCNKIKADFIDASDFHYEEICLVNNKGEEHFPNEMSHRYRVPLWLKSNCECVICGKPASYVGELEFGRKNSDDSWHFLNIDTYCTKHAPE